MLRLQMSPEQTKIVVWRFCLESICSDIFIIKNSGLLIIDQPAVLKFKI